MPNLDLTQGAVPRTLFALTAPMMMAVSSSILVQMLEMGFIGQLGTEYVAAITFTFPITMILTSIALGISIGTSSVIARTVGAKDMEDVRRLSTHSLILIGCLMTALSVIGWLFIDPLFIALGAPPTMLPLIHSYLDIYYPSVVLFTVTMGLGSILRANGNAKIPGMIMTAAAGFNLLLDPVLIFGWFGFPKMELAGAATAMVVTRVLTTIALFYYVFRSDFLLLSNFGHQFIGSCKRILHIGLPAMATQMIGPVSAAIVTRLLANHGETVVAGYGVATRIEAVAVMLLFALSGSIGPFVGQNWGANKVDRMQLGLKTAYQFSLAWGLISAVLLFTLGKPIIGLVDDDPKLLATALLYLTIVPWTHGLWGVLMMASASFNALGKPIPSTILSFTRMFIVYVPLAMFLNSIYGYKGIFIATAISNAVIAIFGYFWFKRSFSNRVAYAP